jgi:hypothetical protein
MKGGAESAAPGGFATYVLDYEKSNNLAFLDHLIQLCIKEKCMTNTI